MVTASKKLLGLLLGSFFVFAAGDAAAYQYYASKISYATAALYGAFGGTCGQAVIAQYRINHPSVTGFPLSYVNDTAVIIVNLNQLNTCVRIGEPDPSNPCEGSTDPMCGLGDDDGDGVPNYADPDWGGAGGPQPPDGDPSTPNSEGTDGAAGADDVPGQCPDGSTPDATTGQCADAEESCPNHYVRDADMNCVQACPEGTQIGGLLQYRAGTSVPGKTCSKSGVQVCDAGGCSSEQYLCEGVSTKEDSGWDSTGYWEAFASVRNGLRCGTEGQSDYSTIRPIAVSEPGGCPSKISDGVYFEGRLDENGQCIYYAVKSNLEQSDAGCTWYNGKCYDSNNTCVAGCSNTEAHAATDTDQDGIPDADDPDPYGEAVDLDGDGNADAFERFDGSRRAGIDTDGDGQIDTAADGYSDPVEAELAEGCDSSVEECKEAAEAERAPLLFDGPIIESRYPEGFGGLVAKFKPQIEALGVGSWLDWFEAHATAEDACPQLPPVQSEMLGVIQIPVNCMVYDALKAFVWFIGALVAMGILLER